MNMDVDIELFHIGLKLINSANLDYIVDIAIPHLKEHKFNIDEKKVAPFYKFATKDGLLVYANYPANAFNIQGKKDPKKIYDVFLLIKSLLDKEEYSIEDTVDFFEVVGKVNIKGRNPKEFLQKLVSCNNSNFKPQSIKFINDDLQNTLPAEFVICPKPTNPVQILYLEHMIRFNKVEDVKKCADNYILTIKKLMGDLNYE